MNLFRLYNNIHPSRIFFRHFHNLLRFFQIKVQFVKLPYDSTNPIIYDKDEAINCYTDDYLMALASAGDITLVGMITSSSIAPYNEWVSSEDYERFVAQRIGGIKHARSSGFRNIPDPVRGPKGHLKKPASSMIEDTQPIGSEGSWLIVNEAKKASPDKPLVVVMGTALTVAADAYLLDNSIADKIVLAWLGGRNDDMGDYNGWADGWGAYIALKKLRLVLFPVWQADPYVPKSRLMELPDTELRQWMIGKHHPNGSPGARDADAPPAISLMRPDYVIQTKQVSFSHWIDVKIGSNVHQVPAFKNDPSGRALIVTYASKEVATEEWWRALKNSLAYDKVITKKI